MKEVRLGDKVYFVTEEGEPAQERIMFFVPGSPTPPITRRHDVFTQDGKGSLVPVYDEFTIAAVKKKAAELLVPSKKSGPPSWRQKLKR